MDFGLNCPAQGNVVLSVQTMDSNEHSNSGASFRALSDSPLQYGKRNWPLCIIIAATLVTGSLWLLFSQKPDYHCNMRAAELPVLFFNLAVALYFSFVLTATYCDTHPLLVVYKVPGRDDIPQCMWSFRGIGRWVAFTLWSNTLGTLYYWVAAVVGMLVLSERAVPGWLCIAQEMLWEITLPMAFLVNIVVTVALIPMCAKQGKFESLWWMTRWRSLSLHNGFVIAAAIECGLATPRAVRDHLPVMVLYGCTYVIFAWGLWYKTRIYLYFFLDPRFKHAPLALVGLVALLAALYLLGSGAASAAATGPWRWVARVVVVLLALATCTWRHPDAKAPSADGP